MRGLPRVHNGRQITPYIDALVPQLLGFAIPSNVVSVISSDVVSHTHVYSVGLLVMGHVTALNLATVLSLREKLIQTFPTKLIKIGHLTHVTDVIDP